MGNQAGGNSKQRSMPQPSQGGYNGGSTMPNTMGGGGSKGQGGGKQRSMPNPARQGMAGGAPDDDMGMQARPTELGPSGTGMSAPTADGSYTPDQRKMLEEAGMGRENWDDNSYQTDGGPTGAQLLAQMNGMTDPSQQHAFFNKYAGKGRGGNDFQSRLLVDKGGLQNMNQWINDTGYGGGTAYNGAIPTPTGAAGAAGAAPPPGTDPLERAPTIGRKPMPQQRSMRRARGGGGNIPQMLARLMGGG